MAIRFRQIDEYANGCQHGNQELRQVLAIICLQLLHAVDGAKYKHESYAAWDPLIDSRR